MAVQIKKIAVITSGGDCQAMNAAIRAVVLAARKYDIEVVGISDGYYGMTYHYPEAFKALCADEVENIIGCGGTVLNSARFDEFEQDPEGIARRAAANLGKAGVEALVIIGGDGSFRGGLDLLKYCNIPCVGIPATIDNDIVSTEYTLGFDTALRNTIEVCDSLRDTCNSHKRCNVVEVMGRKAGQIALHAAIAVGASAVSIPEAPGAFDEDKVIDRMIEARRNGKRSFLVIFAEGAENTGLPENDKKAALDAAVRDYDEGKIDAKALTDVAFHNYKAKYSEQFVSTLRSRSLAAFEKYYAETGNIDFKGEYIETKFMRCAHMSRGGRPTTFDRVVAGHMGEAAIALIAEGKLNRVICVHDGRIADMDMVEAISVDSFYRKFRKTGSYDEAKYNELTDLQKKLFAYRLNVSEHLLATAAALSEI
ncbi:MAG: ATP-dependent 6-phosphofructokinase [Clostridia bacterium]|nr:ATP-dependent 6-phosphofructokinase [Clostridia bacterium]